MKIIKNFYTKCWNPQFTLVMGEMYMAIIYEPVGMITKYNRVSFIPLKDYQSQIYTTYDIGRHYTSVSENLLHHICYTEQEMRDHKLNILDEKE